MSRHVSFDLTVVARRPVTLGQIVSALTHRGWIVVTNGKVTYVIDSSGDFNWTSEPVSDFDRLIRQLDEKWQIGNTVGLTLTWGNSDLHIDVLFLQNGLLSFILPGRRKTLTESSEFTDVSWYLTHMVAPIVALAPDLVIESVKWSEHV